MLVGVYYNTINPLMGVTPGLKAFVAAVFGGIGRIPGAMVGGYFIGIVEVLVSGYGNSMYRDAVVFAILILILILKPAGLLGKNAVSYTHLDVYKRQMRFFCPQRIKQGG